MLILTGTALVLLTWAVCLLGLTVLGLPLAALTRRGPLGLADLRRGLWWGLLLIIVVVYLGNLVWPAASGTMAFAVMAIVLCARMRRRLPWCDVVAGSRAGVCGSGPRSSGWRLRQPSRTSQWLHSDP